MATRTMPKQAPKVDQINTVPAHIDLAQHHSEMKSAYLLGADCVNRTSTMIDAALQIANGANPPTASIHLLRKFLKECQYFSEDLAGLMEYEGDTQARLANEEKCK